MKKYIFYELAMETGAGDEPLAVDFDKENLVCQQLEYDEITKIYPISFDEYVECLIYLGYSLKAELKNLGKSIEENKVDFRERNCDIEVINEGGKLHYRGYWEDPNGKELWKNFDNIRDAEDFTYEPRYYVVKDLQGGSFGMDRFYTIEQWREQALDWLDADDADDETKEVWKNMPEDKLIENISDFWQIRLERC